MRVRAQSRVHRYRNYLSSNQQVSLIWRRCLCIPTYWTKRRNKISETWWGRRCIKRNGSLSRLKPRRSRKIRLSQPWRSVTRLREWSIKSLIKTGKTYKNDWQKGRGSVPLAEENSISQWYKIRKAWLRSATIWKITMSNPMGSIFQIRDKVFYYLTTGKVYCCQAPIKEMEQLI